MGVMTIDLHALGIVDAKRAVGRLQPFGKGQLDLARRTLVLAVRRGLCLSKLAMGERDAGPDQPCDEREGESSR